MANFFIGQISIFSFQFAPKSFAQANGQVLAISQNQALFSLLGTTYGGNGVTTFQLPNLEGRVAISSGGGPGLSSYQLGETGGQESHTLQTTEMPAHAHQVAATTTAGTLGPAAGNVLAGSPMYRN